MTCMIDERCRKQLLAVARDAIARRLGVPSSPPHPSPESKLEANRPIFVTLAVAGKLRGCVGYMDPSGALE